MVFNITLVFFYEAQLNPNKQSFEAYTLHQEVIIFFATQLKPEP